MLNLIRDNVQSFGVKFIVGFIVLVMVGFGVTSFSDQGISTLVTIDGYEVKVARYQRAFDQAKTEIRQQFKERSEEYINMINLPAQIVNRLVNNVLLLKNAENNGLVVTDRELAQDIFENPTFLTDGRFDAKKYSQMLKNLRLEKLAYEQDLRENILTRKYIQFFSSGLLFSHQFVEQEYKRSQTEMKVKLIEFKKDLFSDQVKLSEEEIKNAYEMSKSNFEQKKQFQVKYFILSIDDVDGKAVVRDKEISKYYEKNKNREFTTKDSFLSRHILIPVPKDKNEKGMETAKNKATDIYRQILKKRNSFAAVAKKVSSDQASARMGGSLGWVEKGTFVKEFENAVDGLKKNEISKPFLSAFGYHIVQLMDTKKGETKSLKNSKKEITEKIGIKKSKRRLKNKVAKLMKNTEGKTFDDLSVSNGKKVKHSKAFDDFANLEEIGYSYNLYQSLKAKNVSDVGYYDLSGEKGTLIYKIEKVIDPFIKPLDDVKDKVQALAKDLKSQKMAKEKLEESVKKITTVKQLTRLAFQLKTDVKTLQFKTSDSSVGEFKMGENFRTEVYGMKINQVKSISDNNQNYLVYLVGKTKGSLKSAENGELQKLESELKTQKANLLLMGLIDQMRKEVEIEYNPSLLKALNIKLN